MPIDPIGGAGAATFAILVEDGASVTYTWSTDIFEAQSGIETRRACRTVPSQRYQFQTLLTDGQHRKILSTLAGKAAGAPLFLLGLSYEALPVMSSTTGSIVVPSLALCDWAVPGQRIVVRGSDGTLGGAVVQSSIGASINVDNDLTAIARLGADVMPAMGVFLDRDQAFGRYAVGAGRWELVARSELDIFAPGAIIGAGAVVNTFDSLPVWDVGIAHELADQPLYSGVDVIDLGARISTLGSYTEVAWGRAVRIHSHTRADWQWIKRFLHTVRGQQRAWLLPSGRPDLIPVGDASTGTLAVVGPPVADAPDYVDDWFPSLAHRRLRLVKTDGTFGYRKVTSCVDLGGTQNLVLDSPLAGALDRVEFLEQVRIDGDAVTVTWSGAGFDAALKTRVVQQ